MPPTTIEIGGGGGGGGRNVQRTKRPAGAKRLGAKCLNGFGTECPGTDPFSVFSDFRCGVPLFIVILVIKIGKNRC